MVIDIKKAEKEFKRYTGQFDKNMPTIDRKFYHGFRVAKLSEKIARKLGTLSEEEIELARLIGLLHDIGRFEQWTRYQTFSDLKSIDHAALGIAILEQDEYIKNYVEDEDVIAIIKKAIYYHNKYAIEESDVTEKEKLFCQIIRDADKLDIMYEATYALWEGEEKVIGRQAITPKVVEQVLDHSCINRETVKCKIDEVITNVAFTYDFNFDICYPWLKEGEYINQTLDRFEYSEETKATVEKIRKEVNQFIEAKCKE